VWSNRDGGPGSGCSVYEPKPPFQTDTGCPRRAVADVAVSAGIGRATSDAKGHYTLAAPPGGYDAVVQAYGTVLRPVRLS
jgi:hypothetical protein